MTSQALPDQAPSNSPVQLLSPLSHMNPTLRQNYTIFSSQNHQRTLLPPTLAGSSTGLSLPWLNWMQTGRGCAPPSRLGGSLLHSLGIPSPDIGIYGVTDTCHTLYWDEHARLWTRDTAFRVASTRAGVESGLLSFFLHPHSKILGTMTASLSSAASGLQIPAK